MHGDGDGWAAGPKNTVMWGRFGAAGLLLYAEDTKEVLLQHRALWTNQGGTWALPGGARDSLESAVDAALREAAEETAIDVALVDVCEQHVTAGPFPFDPERPELAGDWTYTTVIARTITGLPIAFEANEESEDLRWVHVDEVADMPLLSAFALSWNTLRLRLEVLA